MIGVCFSELEGHGQASGPVAPAAWRSRAIPLVAFGWATHPATRLPATSANEPGPDRHDSRQDGRGASDLRVTFAPRKRSCPRPRVPKPRWSPVRTEGPSGREARPRTPDAEPERTRLTRSPVDRDHHVTTVHALPGSRPLPDEIWVHESKGSHLGDRIDPQNRPSHGPRELSGGTEHASCVEEEQCNGHRNSTDHSPSSMNCGLAIEQTATARPIYPDPWTGQSRPPPGVDLSPILAAHLTIKPDGSASGDGPIIKPTAPSVKPGNATRGGTALGEAVAKNAPVRDAARRVP